MEQSSATLTAAQDQANIFLRQFCQHHQSCLSGHSDSSRRQACAAHTSSQRLREAERPEIEMSCYSEGRPYTVTISNDTQSAQCKRSNGKSTGTSTTTMTTATVLTAVAAVCSHCHSLGILSAARSSIGTRTAEVCCGPVAQQGSVLENLIQKRGGPVFGSPVARAFLRFGHFGDWTAMTAPS